MIKAYFIGEKIHSNSPVAFSLYEKSKFGEKKNSRIEYSPTEALYLIESKKLLLFSGKKQILEDALIKKLKRKDKKIETKFAVFRDLRKKGHLVKTALKYGSEFRVYERGSSPGDEHARWLVFTAKSSDSINWHDLSAKNRIAHSTKKKLLIALVDEEDDVTYYEFSWIKP